MRSLEQIEHDNKRVLINPRITRVIVDHELEEMLRRTKESLLKYITHNPEHIGLIENIDKALGELPDEATCTRQFSR